MHAIAIALCVMVLHASAVFAQNGPPAAAPAVTPSPEPQPAAPVDPEKLPVSIERIRLQLSHAPATKTFRISIQETVEVVGKAPPLQLWTPENAKLAFGPVPYGAPTHKDFIALHTPEEFKRYPMDLNALMLWLMEQLNKKKPE
jgi:hypothetical protein